MEARRDLLGVSPCESDCSQDLETECAAFEHLVAAGSAPSAHSSCRRRPRNVVSAFSCRWRIEWLVSPVDAPHPVEAALGGCTALALTLSPCFSGVVLVDLATDGR